MVDLKKAKHLPYILFQTHEKQHANKKLLKVDKESPLKISRTMANQNWHICHKNAPAHPVLSVQQYLAAKHGCGSQPSLLA